MKKIVCLSIFTIFVFLLSCGENTTSISITTEADTTTESSELLPEMPFAEQLNLSQTMIDEFDELLNDQVLFLSDDLLIHKVSDVETVGVFLDIDYFIRVVDDTSNDFPIGKSRLDFFLGYDQTNNVVYYNSQDQIKHSGDYSEENEIDFNGDLQYYNPYIFEYGNEFYDYLGNDLTDNIDGTLVVYDYDMGEDIYFHSFNSRINSEDACTINTYKLGDDQPVASHTLLGGYQCGTVQRTNYDYAIIDVYDDPVQIGYISIDKSGIIKTFYAEDYLPEGAQVELQETFQNTYQYMYFRYNDLAGDSYYMLSDLGVTGHVSHFQATDFVYLDEEIFVYESEEGYKIIRDDFPEYLYVPQSGSMTVLFYRVGDYLVLNDVAEDSITSFYNLNTKQIEFSLDGYYYGAYGSAQDKIVYRSDTYHVYDLNTSTDIDLESDDTFKYVDNRYFILFNDEDFCIYDTETNESYNLDLVAVYATDIAYTNRYYAFVGRFDDTYYIIG